MIARRAWPLLLLVAIGLALPAPVDAQFWTKAREAARKAEEIARLLRTAVRCTFTDEQCIEGARAGNKPVVLTDAQGKVITDKDGTPVTDPDKLPPEQKAQAAANANAAAKAAGPVSLDNEFAAGTVVERFGAIGKPLDQFLISEDGAHAAVPGLQGSRQVIIVDGEPGPAFDQVEFNTLRFSPTGGRHAYRARRGAECVVVVDGREVSALPLTECKLTEFLFTRDGSHLAWLEVRRNNARMFTSTLVIDGKRVLSHTGSEEPRLFVRGDHIFYADSTRVYVDQKPDSPFGTPGPLIASDDGSHYAYVARAGRNQERVVVNGTPGPVFPSINALYMEMHSGAVLYHVTTGDSVPGPGMSRKVPEQAYVFRGEVYRRSQVGGPTAPSPHQRLAGIRDPNFTVYDAVNNEAHPMIAISRDGKRLAFATTVPGTGRAAIFADGKLGTSYESVSAPRFTGDGTRLFYTGTSGGRDFAVVDGAESEAHDKIWDVIIGNRNAFAYRTGGLGINPTHWVVNGRQSAPVKVYSPGTFTFSPDDAHYAFAGETAEEYFIEVDGERRNHGVMVPSGLFHASPTGGPAKGFGFPAFAFSADGNRLAYLAMAGNPGRYQPVLMLDDEQITQPGDHYTHLAFSPAGKHFAYLRSRRPPQGPNDRYPLPPVWVLHIDGRTGPVVGERLLINPKTVSFIDENTIRVMAVQDGEIIMHTVSF